MNSLRLVVLILWRVKTIENAGYRTKNLFKVPERSGQGRLAMFLSKDQLYSLSTPLGLGSAVGSSLQCTGQTSV